MKVIRRGESLEWVKAISCTHCESELEIDLSDLRLHVIDPLHKYVSFTCIVCSEQCKPKDLLMSIPKFLHKMICKSSESE